MSSAASSLLDLPFILARDQLRFFGELRCRSQPEALPSSFLRTLYRQDWVVYAKAAFSAAPNRQHYLARYTHRVAISNHRLLSVASQVRSSSVGRTLPHHGRQRTLARFTDSTKSSLRRFAQRMFAQKAFPVISASSTSRQPQTSSHAAPLPRSAPPGSASRNAAPRKAFAVEVAALPWAHASR